METTQDPTTSQNFVNKFERFDKYADNLADMFGSIFVLSMGSIIFAIISYFQKGEWKLLEGYFWQVIIASAVIGLLSLGLMFYFAKRVPVFMKKEKAQTHQNVNYVISKYSYETLIAAGVGKDITDHLKLMRGENELIMSIPFQSAPGEIDWLGDLKSKFGETRVADFEEDLLKYTRRKRITNDTEEFTDQ
jgi:hypothetical protein